MSRARVSTSRPGAEAVTETTLGPTGSGEGTAQRHVIWTELVCD
jgi:hypothetical protein